MEIKDFNVKVKALIGEIGRVATADELGFHNITLARRIKNPGTWKYDEIKKIDEAYDKYFPNGLTEKEA